MGAKTVLGRGVTGVRRVAKKLETLRLILKGVAVVEQQRGEEEFGREEPAFGVCVPTEETLKIGIDEGCATTGCSIVVVVISVKGVAELGFANRLSKVLGCRDRIRGVALAEIGLMDRQDVKALVLRWVQRYLNDRHSVGAASCRKKTLKTKYKLLNPLTA